MSTFQDKHLRLEAEIQARLKEQPVEKRIQDPDARRRMYALGQYAKTHRIKDDDIVSRTYFDTWTILRNQGLTDNRIGDIFQAGKQNKVFPQLKEEQIWLD